jgi:rhodanese-related sulfurtransferase
MAAFNEITPAALWRRIETAQAPLILDVRVAADVDDDPNFLPLAVHAPFDDFQALLRVTDEAEEVVVYCQKGLKISMGVAARLRAQGRKAVVLTGGHFGWRDAGLPLLASAEPTIWVTRHRPKIDRMACHWLIRRFVDARAQFLFLAPSQVLNVADRFGATAFDIDGAPFAHHDDRCTFDALLTHFALETPALTQHATIIRAADLGALDAVPEARGLLAMSLGLSRIHRNDNQQCEAAMSMYDALFRWVLDAQNETHSHD